MTRKRKFVYLAAAAGLGMIALLAVRRPSAIEVEVATVRYDTLRVTIENEGRTRARDRYTIASPVTGRLSRISIREGDSLAQGATVAQLFPAPEDPRAIASARAQIAAAEARSREAAARVDQLTGTHQQAVREAERRRRVYETGGLALEIVEQAGLAAASAAQLLEAAREGQRAADAEVDAARALLMGANADASGSRGVVVRAPVAGRVLRVLEKSERVVTAGTPLVELGNAGGLEVVIDVLSEDAVQVEAGDPIRITEWGGDAVLTATVRLVEPAAFTRVSALGVEEQRVNIIGDLFHAPPSLGTGYRATAAIVTWQGDHVLTVPASALFRQGTGWQVFVVENGRARLREVQLGQRGREAAEIAGGLTENEVVILFPSAGIADGVRVRANGPVSATS